MRPEQRIAAYEQRRMIEQIADRGRLTAALEGSPPPPGSSGGIQGVNEIDLADLLTAPWYDWRWRYRVALTIDHAHVAGALTDYVFLLYATGLPAGFFGASQASGHDVLLTAADGVTKLDYRRVTWTPATPVIELHVLLPTVSHTADTLLWLYTGNPMAVDQVTAAPVLAAEGSGHSSDWTTTQAANAGSPTTFYSAGTPQIA